LQTIANREAATAIATKWYEDQVHHLKQHVLHYEDSFDWPPNGYMLNNGKVTNFHILVSDGLYQEAKWIHLNDNGTISAPSQATIQRRDPTSNPTSSTYTCHRRCSES
jgi:hypothetical protein